MGKEQNQKSITTLLYTFFVMVTCMSLYEMLKQFIYPQITIWESHIVTITFSSTMATFAAYFIQRTYKKLQEQALHEVQERKQTKLLLSKAYDDLEVRVTNRTQELQTSNKRLKKEIQIRKLTETKLRRSEERFSKVFHNAPLAIGIVDFTEERFLMVNNSFIRLMECDDKGQVHGKTVYDLDMWVNDDEWHSLRYQLGDDNSIPFETETRIRTILGEVHNILLSAEKINVNGKVCILIMLHDTNLSKTMRKNCTQRMDPNDLQNSYREKFS
ncbi:MAG TPA: PAS domain S-box protein [Balneolales bacterium]|nr:PAS domain S-box protein [Balneolales bacterium]